MSVDVWGCPRLQAGGREGLAGWPDRALSQVDKECEGSPGRRREIDKEQLFPHHTLSTTFLSVTRPCIV